MRHHRLRLATLSVISAIWLIPTYLLVVNAVKDATAFTASTTWQLPDGFHLLDNLRLAQDKTDLLSARS